MTSIRPYSENVLPVSKKGWFSEEIVPAREEGESIVGRLLPEGVKARSLGVGKGRRWALQRHQRDQVRPRLQPQQESPRHIVSPVGDMCAYE